MNPRLCKSRSGGETGNELSLLRAIWGLEGIHSEKKFGDGVQKKLQHGGTYTGDSLLGKVEPWGKSAVCRPRWVMNRELLMPNLLSRANWEEKQPGLEAYRERTPTRTGFGRKN